MIARPPPFTNVTTLPKSPLALGVSTMTSELPGLALLTATIKLEYCEPVKSWKGLTKFVRAVAKALLPVSTPQNTRMLLTELWLRLLPYLRMFASRFVDCGCGEWKEGAVMPPISKW